MKHQQHFHSNFLRYCPDRTRVDHKEDLANISFEFCRNSSPVSGISIGRWICRICSKLFSSGESPLCDDEVSRHRMREKWSFTSMTTKDSTINDGNHRKTIKTLQWITHKNIYQKEVTNLTLLNNFHNLMLYRRLPARYNESKHHGTNAENVITTYIHRKNRRCDWLACFHDFLSIRKFYLDI